VGHLKKAVFVVSVVLSLIVTMNVVSMAFAAAKTPNLWIHVFPSEDAGNQALEDGTIDISAWPLSREWVARWTPMLQTVQMESYVEPAVYQIDLNNQRWPTGDSGSKFYNSSRSQSVMAAEFRKAIACLVDRDAIFRDVLGGWGVRIDVPVLPSQSAYADPLNYTISAIVYNFNRTRATQILDAAGFVTGEDGKTRVDPLTGDYLTPLTFLIRSDDPIRLQIGQMLAEELVSIGIPVNAKIFDKILCLKNAMILYDYSLYTGGWSLGTLPDSYYDLYSSNTYYGPNVGGSDNYVGFCNHEFDGYAAKAKYPATISEAQEASKTCGYLFLKYCAVVPIYCPKAVKAYKTGWAGTVNDLERGVDDYYSFLNMSNTGDDTIDWGFKENITTLNVIRAEANLWGWRTGMEWGSGWGETSDTKMLDLVYEGLLERNLCNQALMGSGITENYTVGSWNASAIGGDPDASVITFNIRSNATFHNVTGGTRKPIDAYAIGFSFNLTEQFIPNYWSHPLFEIWAEVVDNDTIKFFCLNRDLWFLHWVGSFRIVNPDIWGRIGGSYQARLFDPAKSDINSNGILDIKEDGTGGWMFDQNASGSIRLTRDDNYYLSSVDIENRIKQMFHAETGDINSDGVVNILDLSLLARALGTTPASGGTPRDWGAWNPQCDLNGDEKVDIVDLVLTTSNYGRTLGQVRADSG
jgi:ABC-type transport system substrate-binding protein